MAKLGVLLVIVGCVVLAFTNPGAEAHKTAVYGKLSDQVGMTGLGGDLVGNALGNLDVIPLKYNNYLLFSTMTFRDDIASVGLFNYVRATKKEWASGAVRPGEQPGDSPPR